MSGESTIYELSVRTVLDDRATAALERIGDRAAETERHLSGLTEGFRHLGEFVIGGEAMRKGKEWLVDYNREMQDLRISSAAMLQANDLAKTFESATDQANKLTEEFQRFATQTPVTTKDLVAFSGGIETAVAQAQGGIADITKVTEQGVVAAKVFGAEANYAALEITEGIQMGGNSRMRFLKQLLATQHETIEQFKGLSESGRLNIIERALDSPAMRAASKAFGESFSGVISTLEDNLQITFGRIGLPLFKAITAEVQHWNQWIADHPREIEEFATRFGGALADGFHAVRDAVGFIVDHKDVIMTLAKVWAITKVTGALGGGQLGGMLGLGGVGLLGRGGAGGGAAQFDHLTGFERGLALGKSGVSTALGAAGGAAAGWGVAEAQGMDRLGKAAMAVEGAMASLPGPIGMVGQALMGLTAISKGIADHLWQERLERTDEMQQRRSYRVAWYAMENGSIETAYVTMKALERSHTQAAQEELEHFKGIIEKQSAPYIDIVRRAGAVDAEGNYDPRKLEAMRPSNMKTAEWNVFADSVSKRMAQLYEVDREGLAKRFGGGGDRGVDAGKKAAAPSINVHISKIEVPSDDPDRFVFSLVKSFARVAKNPVQADSSLRGGF